MAIRSLTNGSFGAGRNGGSAAKRWSIAAAVIVFGALAMPTQAQAQTGTSLPTIRKSIVEGGEIRDNHVGIVTGGPAGVYARLGADMVRLLDDRPGRRLRISAVMGSGSVANLDDLRNLPGISFAILQGDVLDAYAGDRDQYQWLDQNIRYVGRLHNELLHVVVREDLLRDGASDVCALAGRRINVGGAGSGTRITANRVFNEMLGLGVVFDAAATEEGLEQLSKRQVDAVAFVVGPPAPIFANDRAAKTFADDRLAFLPVPASVLATGCGSGTARPRGEPTVYEDAALTGEHYPQLIAADRRIATLAVPAVLAAYRFEETTSPRARATATLIQSYLSRGADPLDGFGRLGGGFATQWCGLDLIAPVARWRRHEAVEAWLQRNRGRNAPTVVECRKGKLDRSFCASHEGKAEEFRKRMAEVDPRLTMQDPAYMSRFAAFIARECP